MEIQSDGHTLSDIPDVQKRESTHYFEFEAKVGDKITIAGKEHEFKRADTYIIRTPYGYPIRVQRKGEEKPTEISFEGVMSKFTTLNRKQRRARGMK